jgi:hypothetical protein
MRVLQYGISACVFFGGSEACSVDIWCFFSSAISSISIDSIDISIRGSCGIVRVRQHWVIWV